MGELGAMIFVLTRREEKSGIQYFNGLGKLSSVSHEEKKGITVWRTTRTSVRIFLSYDLNFWRGGEGADRDWLKWHFLLGTSFLYRNLFTYWGSVSESKGKLTFEETLATTFWSALSEHVSPDSIYSRWSHLVYMGIAFKYPKMFINRLQTVQSKSSTENFSF